MPTTEYQIIIKGEIVWRTYTAGDHRNALEYYRATSMYKVKENIIDLTEGE